MLKDWRFWAAVVAVVLLIVVVVLYFVSPIFCYFVSGLLVGALAGFTGVYRLAKEIMKDNDDEPSGKGLGTQDVSGSVDRDSDKLHHS